MGDNMNLYFAFITFKKEKGQRKRRIRRYAVMAPTPEEAAKVLYAENNHNTDYIDSVTVDEDAYNPIPIGWSTE